MKVIITAVYERFEFVKYLCNRIKRWPVLISFDGGAGRMGNYTNALKSAGNDAVLMMEEDVLLADNFENVVAASITSYPGQVLQFFSMRKADYEVGTRVETGSKFLMNQCVYLPPGTARSVYWHWKNTNQTKNWTSADLLFRDFLVKTKTKYVVIVPNPVDHRESVSVIDPRRSKKRTSFTFKKDSPHG